MHKSTPFLQTVPTFLLRSRTDWLRPLLTVFLTFLLFDRWTVYNTPLPGLDGSWQIALHVARQLGLRHGTEFVFTYGPLGWLITRLPLAAPAGVLVGFDALWLANVAAVLWWAVGPRPTLRRVLILTGLAGLHRMAAGSEIPFEFYFFTLFWLFCHQRTGSRWALTAAVGLATLTFFLKANVGLVCVGSVGFYALWLLGRPSADRLSGVVVLAGISLAVGLSARALSVRLGPFLVAQWHLISSYNDVMAVLNREQVPALLAVGITLGLTLGLIGRWLGRAGTHAWPLWQQDGCLLLLTGVHLFVLYKEATVRADAGHVSLFFKYALLPYGLLNVFGRAAGLRRLVWLPLGWLTLTSFAFVTYHWDAGLLYRPFVQGVAYARDVVQPLRPVLTPDPTPWPAEWSARLRGRRVDVLPEDVASVYASGLRYAPRPVIQTYQVTDAYLDSLNAAYFLSARAPDYVLMTEGATDGRDPFADETGTKLSLLRAYEVVDQTATWLLLQRRPVPLAIQFVREPMTQAKLNEPIAVADDSTDGQLWQVSGQYTLAGQVARLLFQPPRLWLELTYATGQRVRFRTALPLLRMGLLLPAHPRRLTDWSRYVQTGGHLPDSARVRQLRLTTDSRLPALFAPALTVTRWRYRLSHS